MNPLLLQQARQLRLSGLMASLELRLMEARTHQLTHEQFLELIIQDELNVRQQRLIEKRVRGAQFRDRKSLEDFDWSFNASVPRGRIYELATGAFVREKRDVLFIGPPGLGKSHLAQAIGYHVIKAGFTVYYRSIFEMVSDLQGDQSPGEVRRTLERYLKPELLIIDDMGIKALPPRSGEVLLEVILRRYETRSTLMTSNRPIEEWGKALQDAAAATAILDRLLHHAELIQLTGKSYRLEQAARRAKKTAG